MKWTDYLLGETGAMVYIGCHLTAFPSHAEDISLAQGDTTYTVRNGDNLSKLAKIKLGDSSRWKDISKYINASELNYIKAHGLYDTGAPATATDNIISFPGNNSDTTQALPDAG